MKYFLEEHGLIIVVVAVIMVMLLLGTTVGADAKQNIVATVANFLDVAEQVYPDLENEDVTEDNDKEEIPEIQPLPIPIEPNIKYALRQWNTSVIYQVSEFEYISNFKVELRAIDMGVAFELANHDFNKISELDFLIENWVIIETLEIEEPGTYTVTYNKTETDALNVTGNGVLFAATAYYEYETEEGTIKKYVQVLN